jgi:hypothetical protein
MVDGSIRAPDATAGRSSVAFPVQVDPSLPEQRVRGELEQETNAYAVLPESQWQGYRPPPEAPEPEWGQAPIMHSALVLAALEGDLAGKVQVLLASDPKDGLAAALARLGRAFLARDS